MYTQCPECLTIFEIDEDALQASLGIVHCGHCSTRFDALRSLSNTLPLDPEAPLIESDVEPKVLTLTTAVSPAELELAARKSRRAEHPQPASGSSTTATPTGTAAGGHSSVDTNTDWLVNLRTDLTDALIADAAGIAPGDTQPDNTWRLLDAPVQARFSELDIIPVAASERAATESMRDESADAQAEPASGDADTVDQIPATDPDQLEILPTAVDDSDAVHAAPEPVRSDPESGDVRDDMDDITPAEIDDFDSAETDAIDLPEMEAAAAEAEAVDIATETPSETAEAQAPIYIRPRQRRFNRTSVLWALGCLVLIVILAAQLAWAKRVALLQNPQTRTWARRVCDTIDCHLPPIRDVAKLELLSRDIRPDPRTSGALVITATLRNNANFRQPWPVVTVELSDLDGKPVAMRRFRPAEYMPDAARRAAGMAAGATAAVAFEVADPGKNAVNFQFSFE